MPEAQTVAQAPVSDAAQDVFRCADAPRLLGHPEHTVQVCAEVPHLKGLFKVTLTHPTEGAIGVLVPTDAEGRVERARGPAAATAWIQRVGILADPGLTMMHFMLCLAAFEALPEPLTLDAQDFDQPDVGKASFQAQPLRLEIYSTVPAAGTPAPPRYVRGVLTAGADGKLAWTLEQGGSSPWKLLRTLPAE